MGVSTIVLGSLGTMNILINATNTASDDINEVKGDMGSLAGSARAAGSALTAFGAAGAAAAGIATANYADFEEQMIEVQKVTGMSNKEMKGLSDTIREMSAGPLPASATELGKIAAQAGSIGVDGTKNIAEFTETVQKMAIATRLSSEESAEQIARISNAFDIPTSKAEQMGSTINELSNQTSAWSDEISTGLRKAAPSANAAGASLQETAGIVSTLVGNGMRAERAGTRLNRVFGEMTQKSGKMAETMGVSNEEMLNMIQNDPTGALLNYVEAANEADNTQKLLGDTFGSSSAKVLRMIQNTDEVRSKIDTANKAFKQGNSLQQEYEQASKGLNTQLQNLQDKFFELGNAIGERVAPILKNTIIPAVGSVTDAFNSLSGPMKDVVIGAGLVATGLALVLGPALLLVGFIPSIVSGLSMVATAAAAVSAPMLLAGAAIAGVAAAIATNFMGIRDAIVKSLQAVWSYMKPVVNAMIGLFQSLTAFVLEGIGRQMKFFGKLSDVLAQVFGFIMPLVKNAGATLITTFFTIVNALKFVMDNFHKVWGVIGDIVSGSIEFIVDGVEFLVNRYISAINDLIAAYNAVASEVPMLSTVQKLDKFEFKASGLGDFKAENIGKKRREQLDKARVDLAGNIAGEGAAKAVKNFQNAVEGVPDGLRTAGDKAVKLGNNLQDTAENLRNSEDATVGSLSKSAKDALGGVLGGGKEKPQTKKQGKGMLRQLKMLRKEQRKQRNTPQGEGGKTVIEEGAINVNESQNPDETSKAIFRGISARGGQVQ